VKLTTSMLLVAGLLAPLLLTQIGCSESGQEPAAANPALTSPIPEGMVRGTVKETMNAGGYTYLLLEAGENQRWAAAPMTVVQVGDVVQTDSGMPMAEFTSKSLDRTFDVIYFVGAIENLSAPAVIGGNPETATAPMIPATPKTSKAVPQEISVAELEPGQNIAFVFANKESLTGHQVSLRGSVVKFNANILGTNFIHIQDGSGDPADGNNDLTVTSSAATAVGETIIVTGTVILDKDFGAGYRFPLLLEDANITSE